MDFHPAIYFDKYDVTQADYKRFIPDHEIPPGKAQFSVTDLSPEKARAYVFRCVKDAFPLEKKDG